MHDVLLLMYSSDLRTYIYILVLHIYSKIRFGSHGFMNQKQAVCPSIGIELNIPLLLFTSFAECFEHMECFQEQIQNPLTFFESLQNSVLRFTYVVPFNLHSDLNPSIRLVLLPVCR